jgi:hypothetical protein
MPPRGRAADAAMPSIFSGQDRAASSFLSQNAHQVGIAATVPAIYEYISLILSLFVLIQLDMAIQHRDSLSLGLAWKRYPRRGQLWQPTGGYSDPLLELFAASSTHTYPEWIEHIYDALTDKQLDGCISPLEQILLESIKRYINLLDKESSHWRHWEETRQEMDAKLAELKKLIEQLPDKS